MVEISECPVCNGTVFQTIAQCQDHTVSHETFIVKQCTSCQLGITSPRPEDDKLESYYQSEEYISHSGKSTRVIGLLYKIARFFSIRWKKNMIFKYSLQGSILDFGCGSGEFVNAFQKASWEISGVEPSALARSKAQILNGKNIYRTLNDVPKSEFDVITAWHVIEHIPQLTENIHRLKSQLKKSGTIFIAVPNYQSYDADHYKNFWAGFDVPRHLWHFSNQTMQMMFESAGLKIVKIIPMKLDAFYVSMLSEKYKTENNFTLLGFIKGLIHGILSNLMARKTKNYSSLIYIVKIHEK